MLRWITAGESHGPALAAVLEGMPAGVPVDKSFIDKELRRRQGGYGRGGRQKIETDPRNPQYIVTVPGLGYRFDA